MSQIAIVDARATNRHIYARLAGSIEPEAAVRAFEDPLDALAWSGETIPDLVIADFRMPHLDCAEFTRRLRALPGCVEVPVVIVAGAEDHKARLSALDAGADVLSARSIKPSSRFASAICSS